MKISFTLIITLFSFGSFAQNNSLIGGIWKGTSICQVKNSPCHDENVVYHIFQTSSLNSYQVLMNKIVNNEEEQMETMVFEYDAKKQTLTSKDTIRNAQWVFTLTGEQIKGTLVYKEQLYRIIDVKKQD